MYPMRSKTPPAALPIAVILINRKIPSMIPHMSATDAVANAAGTTGIDVMEWTAPDGTSSNLIPPTLGMITL